MNADSRDDFTRSGLVGDVDGGASVVAMSCPPTGTKRIIPVLSITLEIGHMVML